MACPSSALVSPLRRVPRPSWGVAVVCGLLGAFPGGSARAAPWFADITQASGLTFVHETGAAGGLAMPEIMGPGCALFDADGDGDLDLYVTNGSFEFSDASGEPPRNRFFRRDGDRYVDATDESGLGDGSYGMGIAVGDWDGDGHVDVYVTNVGPDRLYRNRGDGTFEDVTQEAGVDVPGWSCSAAFADLDADGDLDLFVTRYVDWDPEQRCTDPAGRPEYCGPKESPPVSDVLLRNDGGRFTDVSAASGIASQSAAGLGVTVADFDRDGLADIYVTNDAYANHLWINQGDGTFFDDALLLGAAFNVQGMAEAGMGVVAADFDDDLDLDLFMTHLRNESNTLYVFEGAAVGFEDRTALLGLANPSLRTTGFGTVTLDVDLDGDLDLFVGNGSVNRGTPWPGAGVPSPWDRYAEPNHLYVRGVNGFEVAPAQGGPLADVELTRGVARGDVDGDGDLDVVLVNGHGNLRLLRNDAPREGHWFAVRPVRVAGGPVSLGAEVVVRTGDRAFLRLARAAYSYLSSSDPVAHFGLGPMDRVDSIEIRWPDGSRERFDGAAAEQLVEVVHGTGVELP